MNQSVSVKENVNEHVFVLSNWQFRQAGESQWLSAEVPGCVHTDLRNNQLIPDPFHGKNELGLQWIDKKDWEYETVFDVPEQLHTASRLELVFNGLDTYAEVYLNDQHILSANNMFRTWKQDVKALVQQKNNKLHIRFRSPIYEDVTKLKKLGYNLPAVNDHSEDGEVGDQKLSVFARKAPYHYGWDWGPRFVTSGIWKDVELIGWTEARMTDLFIQQKKVDAASANITAVVEIEAEDVFEGSLQVTTDGFSIEQDVKLLAGRNTISIEGKILNPKLWWSRGLGEPSLYKFSAVLSKNGTRVAEKSVRTGLRSMKLIREKDEHGRSFYIELNGVPVFAKGANHIPNDSFAAKVTYDRYEHEILSAADANMNMLRVWGGGIYEYDEFYELCDEHGILVWQDFMFACSMYPGDQAFLDNVKAEAEDNLKRLRNHPSIALWCGNNEMDTAWAEYDEEAGWGWKQQYSLEARTDIWNAYEAIFHRILPEAVARLSPSEDYWPSSPMSDWTGDKSQHSHYASASGDIHYWDVWHGLRSFEEYNNNIGRFMSEYGFQSFPEYKTVRAYAEEEEMALESEVMLHHQKNGRGNFLIKEYMEQYLPTPKDFPSFLYMSQVLQAEGIKSAIEAHRRNKPFCMGTLYWQMNDCWPVASWASIDYYGRWKALHYYAKKSFQDIMVSIDGTSGDTLHIHVISDSQKPVKGHLQAQLLNFNGDMLREFKESVDLKSNSGEVVLSLNTEELLDGIDLKKVVFHAELIQDEKVIDCKEHYFVSCKEIMLETPSITVRKVSESEFLLEADTLAKQVWLTCETEGVFTENYFDLIPGKQKKVQFLARKPGGFAAGVPEEMTVQSMADFIV